MKVFADATEMVSSTRANPYTDALALGALRILYEDLVRSTEHADDTTARGRCQFAAFMLLPHVLNTGLGIVAGLRHQIGAAFGVPHGVASTIVLPHALRWNVTYAASSMSRAAVALGLVDNGTVAEIAAHRLVEAVERLIVRLKLPQRLREVNVPEEALPRIAERVVGDFLVRTNPRPALSASDVLEVLRSAW
jgi:alcohol dehydrogenase class IV